jgi:hypothetical protein
MLFVPGEITGREYCFDRIEPLTKHPANPVLKPDRPWESVGAEGPSVLYSEADKLFRMWYIASNMGEFGKHGRVTLVDNWSPSGQWFLCYAESRDGLAWDKPALGIVKSRDYPDNNIVMSDSGLFLNTTTVIEDLDDPDPNRRYKLLMYDNDGEGRDGGRTAVSPNGIVWTFIGDFPVLPTQDCPNLWHDRRNGLYVATLKTRLDNRRGRMVSVSRDFATWSPPTVLLQPDLGDSPSVHFYEQSAFHHCGHDLGFLARMEQSTQRIDVELIASPRGGADWRRLPTRPQVLAPGDVGAWDGWMVRPGTSPPIVRGDTCWYFYCGGPAHHDEDCPWAMGIATFTHGRLVGQQFEHDGWFESVAFECPGGELSLDAVAREPLTVAVCSASYGGPIGGYAREECAPVQGDSRDHAIRWSKNPSLDALKGKFIALRVCGKNSIVYGATLR